MKGLRESKTRAPESTAAVRGERNFDRKGRGLVESVAEGGGWKTCSGGHPADCSASSYKVIQVRKDSLQD